MRRHEFLSQQWKNMGSFIASMVPGASLIFNFTGASVAGLGIYDNSFAHNSSVGSYAVDGQEPTYFMIENLSSGELSSLSNQVLFQTPHYPPVPPQIEILYYGTSGTAPLLMTSLLVHNQTMNLENSSLSEVTPPVISSTSYSSTMPAPTVTVATAASSGKQAIDSAAPVIYGLCGALLCVLCVLGLFIFYNRRRRLRELAAADSERAALPFPALILTGPPVNPRSKGMRQHRSDTDTSQISPPALPNPLLTKRGMFSAPVLSPIIRTQLPIWQAPTGQANTDINSGEPRRSPSIRVIVHDDSGMRLPRPIESQVTVVEVPPTYTPL